MRKKIIITSIIIVILVALLAMAVFIINSLNENDEIEEKEAYKFNLKITEHPYDFQWGMTIKEVEEKLLKNRLYKKNQLGKLINCYDYDYQDIPGLTAEVLFSFNDKDLLEGISISINLGKLDNPGSEYYLEPGYYPDEGFPFTANELFDAHLKEMHNVFDEEMKTIEYGTDDIFWIGDYSVIYASMISEDYFSLSFNDRIVYKDSIPDFY